MSAEWAPVIYSKINVLPKYAETDLPDLGFAIASGQFPPYRRFGTMRLPNTSPKKLQRRLYVATPPFNLTGSWRCEIAATSSRRTFPRRPARSMPFLA